MLTMNSLVPFAFDSPVRLEILSSTPGRIRLRFLPECRDPELMNQVSEAARLMLDSVKTVRLNPTIGTLTVIYGAGTVDISELGQTLTAFGIDFVPETSRLAGATASAQLKQVLSGWNKRVNQATGGTSDLRFLAPFLLGLLALRQVMNKNSPRLRFAPWYMLAWYAFDSFMQLNRANGAALKHESVSPAISSSRIEHTERKF